MSRFRWWAVVCCLGWAVGVSVAAREEPDRLKLWYAQPAATWVEALPVGNGHLGAMVFGGVTEARIQLNEESVWAGPPVPEAKPGFKEAMEQARGLWFDGRYVEAQGLVQQHMAPRISPRSYQPLGDLRIRMIGDADEKPEDYRRELDLDSGVATTRFKLDGVTYTREVFCSRPHQVLAVRLTADRPGSIRVRAGLDRAADFEVTSDGPETLVMQGQAQHKGKHLGVKWLTRLAARCEGGRIRAAEGVLEVSDADAVTFYLAASTDYHRGDPSHPLTHDLDQACRDTLAAAGATTVEALRTAAVEAHREQFRRCTLDLGGWHRSAYPTDLRVEKVKQGEEDPALLVLLFQYGRYLLIGSSQPGSLPANLQGIWNEKLEAPWNADFHININIQMNYWIAELTGLTECRMPFFDFVEALVPAGRASARKNFGARGFTANHTTDAWLHAEPFGKVGYGMFPHGAGWCTRSFMDYYRFTGDQGFLRERAYPILKEASLFYLDYLTEHPETGKLVSGLDNSPENRYQTPDGERASLSMGASMSQQIVWDVFHNTLQAADLLGIEDDVVAEVGPAFGRLAQAGIGDDGRLMEWALPFKEPSPGHRHISHLYALHPGAQYNLYDSPEMVDAARKTIDFRLANGGGHTGWSRAWIINFWARFHEAEKAHQNLVALVQKCILPNLFDTHPPFQIDGNFGAASAMAEMLLQSHVQQGGPREPFLVELLPALPKAWPAGSAAGLRARGGLVVDVDWAGGQLTMVRLTALTDSISRIRYRGGERLVKLHQGEIVTLLPEMLAAKGDGGV